MIEAERIKADLEAIAKQQEEEKEIVSQTKRAKEKERRETLVKELTPEPTNGQNISISFRLPNGTRLTRNFRQDEQIKVGSILVVPFRLYLFQRRFFNRQYNSGVLRLSSC